MLAIEMLAVVFFSVIAGVAWGFFCGYAACKMRFWKALFGMRYVFGEKNVRKR